jgi:uncharacterized protein (TIGR03066 family)
MRSTLLSCAALFLLTGFAPLLAADKPKDLIMGKWEKEQDKQKVTLEFAKDGILKVHLAGNDGTNIDVNGKYTFVDDDNMEVEVTYMGETKKEKVKVAVTKEELTTTDGSGKKETFKRVK